MIIYEKELLLFLTPTTGWLLLAIALACAALLKLLMLPLFSPSSPSAVVNSPQEQQEVLAFEQKRLQDSLDRVKKWTAEREARQWAREERERAYQQQRAIWDAEKSCSRCKTGCKPSSL